MTKLVHRLKAANLEQGVKVNENLRSANQKRFSANSNSDLN